MRAEDLGEWADYIEDTRGEWPELKLCSSIGDKTAEAIEA